MGLTKVGSASRMDYSYMRDNYKWAEEYIEKQRRKKKVNDKEAVECMSFVDMLLENINSK